MIPRTAQVGPLASAVANAYALAQAGTAATALTLNGALVASGIGTPLVAQRLVITSAGNDAGITFTIVGRAAVNGPLLTEVMQGTAAAATNLQGQAYSALDYAQVVSITPSGNTAANVTAGTVNVASTAWIRLDNFGYAPIALEVIVSGTVSYTVEAALRDPNIVAGIPAAVTNTIQPAQLVWQPHPNLQAQVVNGFDNYTVVPTWVRCTLLSGSGSCVFTAAQPVNPLRM